MSTELERATAALKRMGVTVRTTAAPGEDSIAGRIQAEAERQGIAETTPRRPRCFCGRGCVGGECVA